VKYYGAIETGGTKTVCAIVKSNGELAVRNQFATDNPKVTLSNALGFLREVAADYGSLEAIGVGSFGPIELRRSSKQYGRILRTPKPGWAGTDVPREVAKFFDLPIAIDTDVNCALLGELNWGAGQGANDLVYITVGTGVGGGILCNGRLVKGVSHPEIGHMLIPSANIDKNFVGVCPFHKSRCVEGLASGPAMSERWGVKGIDLHSNHPAWNLEAHYIATLCANVMLTTAPEKIILGGGVMQHKPLIEKVREQLRKYISGSVELTQWNESLDDFVVSAELGGRAGVMGASVIAAEVAAC
jgi:fructokinase